jgi:DNA primase
MPRDIVEQIKARSEQDPRAVYELAGAGELKTSGQDPIARCPLHRETKASFHVGLRGERKGRHKCVECSAEGDIIDFVAAKERVENHEAIAIMADRLGIGRPNRPAPKRRSKPAPDPEEHPLSEIARELHAALLKREDKLQFLQTERAWTRETIDAALVGYLAAEDRFTLPVFSPDGGEVLDIRKYKLGDDPKMLPWATGTGKAKLYGLNLAGGLEPGRELVITEGEPDALALLSLGFPAITNTSGAGGWPKGADLDLTGVKVLLASDADAAGQDRNIALAPWCYPHGAAEVREIVLAAGHAPRLRRDGLSHPTRSARGPGGRVFGLVGTRENGGAYRPARGLRPAVLRDACEGG